MRSAAGSEAGSTADQEARDEIAGRIDRTLLVHAGAGTGKTTALVGRLITLVASGAVSLGDVAAITFTEAAAAELRDRIRLRLEAATDDPAVPAEVRARLRAARDDVDTAAITTLHGFARAILAENPVEAGLPPGFRVLDDVEASIWFDERWEALVAGLTIDPVWQPTLVRSHALGIDVGHLRKAALTLWDQTDRLGPAPSDPPALPAIDLSGVLRALSDLEELLPGCSDPHDRLLAHVRATSASLAPLLGGASTGDDPGFQGAAPDGPDELVHVIDVLDALGRCPSRSVNRVGRKESWPDIAAVRASAAALGEAVTQVLDAQREAVLDRLVSRLHGFVVDLAAERLREGCLTFQDLLTGARDLLRADAAVRRSVSDRYRCLLIDEFQDTDPLQIELAVLITSGHPDVGGLPWHRTPPDEGRLFVAGDPAQSIYRFRRADLALYHRVEQVLADARRELSVNFRSVPGVLEWVDHVFERLLAGGEPGVQAVHRPLRAHRSPAPGGRPPVAVFGGPIDGSAAEVRAQEARRVARLVSHVVDGGWTITDPATGEPRPARYHDVALLMPDRGPLAALEDALGAMDIPARVESQSFVFDSVEVRELITVLAAVDDPTDEVAVVGSLRSAAFGCGDDDLLSFHDAGGRWDYTAPGPPELPGSHPVVAAMAALRALHAEAAWQRVSDTLATVVTRRRMFATAMGRRRPRDHWRRYRFLLDTARSFDDAAGGGRRDFVDWVQRRIDDGARAIESPGSEPDDDAVRVLTVHGAKGLEFPIVVLAGLGSKPRASSGPVRWRPGGGYEIALGSAAAGSRVASTGYDELGEVEARLDDAERVRLLYVAATRARDHLLVSLHHPGGRACHAAVLHDLHSPAHDAPAARIEVDAPTAGLERGGGDPGDLVDDPAGAGADEEESYGDDGEGVRRHRALLTRASRPATVAATEVARAASGEAPRGGRRPLGRSAANVGRAVHAVLQQVDLPGAADLPAVARAQAAAEGVPELTGRIEALAAGILASPEVVELLASGPWWREVPVAAPLGDVVVEGVIDLLVEAPGGLVVVDYKTDHVPDDAAVLAALERHTPQAAAYAYALERSTGIPVERCAFVFARPDAPAVVRDVADLRGAIDRLYRAVSS